MKISHKEYPKIILDSKKAHLEELRVQHRINLALYKDKEETFLKEISSLERQLDSQ